MKSDASFPEPESFNGPDRRPMTSSRGRHHGRVHAVIRERDYHELWSVLRSFRRVYGEAELQKVIADAASAD